MAIKLKNNSDNLANKKLPHKPKGYDPLEVDILLDSIINDYELVESGILLSKEEYQSLLKQIDALKKDNIQLKIDLDKEKGRWKYISTDSNIHIDNLVLLERIGKLEKVIKEKLHLNPDEINSFDPDDC